MAFARTLAIKPKLLLFDKPTSALDPGLRQEVLQVVMPIADEGMTITIVAHGDRFRG